MATRNHVPAEIGLHPDSGADGRGTYGFNFRVNGIKPDGSRKWPDAPASTFTAGGYNNNDMFVIGDWNMVIVRLGLDQSSRRIADQTCNGFLRRIGASIRNRQ